MPSWNIHIAHVERLLAENDPAELGIDDANAFLFGNLVPDIYVGFMVPDVGFRINYCMTHHARPCTIPVPDADLFWDDNLQRRTPTDPAQLSLTLGAWAHLVADRMYNTRFRRFRESHVTPTGDELRRRKQGDFHLFGESLDISVHVKPTPELLKAAQAFRPYSILPDDVARSIAVADAIVDGRHVTRDAVSDSYQLLDADWMTGTFDAVDERLAIWLRTWQERRDQGLPATAADIRQAAGLPGGQR